MKTKIYFLGSVYLKTLLFLALFLLVFIILLAFLEEPVCNNLTLTTKTEDSNNFNLVIKNKQAMPDEPWRGFQSISLALPSALITKSPAQINLSNIPVPVFIWNINVLKPDNYSNYKIKLSIKTDSGGICKKEVDYK